MVLRQKNKIIEIYTQILGKTPSSESTKKLEALTKALNSTDDDTIIILLGIFEAYYSTLATLPDEVKRTIESYIEELLKTQNALETGLSKAIKEELEIYTRKTKNTSLSKWIGGSIFCSTLIILVAAYFAHSKIYTNAFEAAYHKAFANYQFVDRWAQTKEAQEVLRIYESGQIDHFLNCTGDGWEILDIDGKKVCNPTTGWYIQ